MPAVQAVGVATDRPPPFHLPVLDNRGDVAARLAVIDSMITDDADDASLARDPTLAPASIARANADALADRLLRVPETPPRARPGASADAHRAAARVRPVGTSAVGTSAVSSSGVGTGAGGIGAERSGVDRPRPDRGISPATAADRGPHVAVPPTATKAAGDEARARAAATVPAHTRMLRPDGAPATAPVSYSADDWRGHIKGAPARSDAQVYGAPGGPTSPRAGASSSAAVSVPTARAGDATTPTVVNGARGTAAAAGPGKSTERVQAKEAKPVSMLDRAARIGLLGGLLAIFVLLFIFGPKISQWWGKL
jgi:hypothetical protein